MDEATDSAPTDLLPRATPSQAYQLTSEMSPIWHAPVVPVGPIMRNNSSYSISNGQSTSTDCSQPSNIYESQSVKCEHCQRVFSSKSTFERHICTKPTSHKCSLCSKTFTRRYNLKIHVEKHYGNFQHKCVVCGSGFTKKSSLSKHILKHSAKQSTKLRGQCDICSKVFTRKYSARVHRSTHMENGLWKCPSCPSLFVNTSNLKLHMRIHSNGEHFPVAEGAAAVDIGTLSSASSQFQENEVAREEHGHHNSQETENGAPHPPLHTGGTVSVTEIIGRVEPDVPLSRNRPEDSIARLTSDPVVLASWQSKQVDSSVSSSSSSSSSNAESIVSLPMEIKRETEGGKELADQRSNYQHNASTGAVEAHNNWQSARGYAGLAGLTRWEGLFKKRRNNVGLGTALRQDVDAMAQIPNGLATSMSTHSANLSLNGSSPHAENTAFINPQILTLSTNSGTNHLPPISQSFGAVETHPSSASQAPLPVLPVQQTDSTQASGISTQLSDETKSSWRCGHCCMSFEDGLMFVVHMGCHRQGNPFTCNMCGHICEDRLAFMLHFVQGQH
ncbi:hypothetical protein BSL78_07091 [Apostichopus japonicus]|uniref:C2H2-type domain-containing protein n=1 Tax=Stichopus japonicus TaxID=307972 RepID=A0A2G8L6X7_STIJA|nr:hypothetical protein BSL78_07091 [Apostichopus japonicus]